MKNKAVLLDLHKVWGATRTRTLALARALALARCTNQAENSSENAYI